MAGQCNSLYVRVAANDASSGMGMLLLYIAKKACNECLRMIVPIHNVQEGSS